LLKIIVVVLALANVGYFLWTRDIEHPTEAGPEAPLATLKLTSEVPGSHRGVPQPALEEGPGSPSIAGGIAGDGGANAPGVATPGVATPGVATRVLGMPVLATPSVAGPGAGTAAPLMSVKRCVSVGPFRDESQTARAASTLRSGGYDPRQRVAEGEVVWIDIDLKPTDSVPKPSDLQSETGRIQRLEVKACPNAGAVP
jgi:hypothetical protein